MKEFLGFITLVCCVSAKEWTIKTNQQLREIHIECLDQHSLSFEQISKVRNLELPNEELVRRYLLCTSQKIGVFSTDHGYHADRVAKQYKMDMDEEEAKKLAEECIAKYPKGNKPDDVAAAEVRNCLMKSAIGEKSRNDALKRHRTPYTEQLEIRMQLL